MICRPTQTEAEDYHHHVNVESADWGAIDQMLALKNITPQNTAADEFAGKRSMMASHGVGGYPFVGTPDKIADEFANLGRAGFRGSGGLVRELSQRRAVFLCRSASSPRPDGASRAVERPYPSPFGMASP